MADLWSSHQADEERPVAPKETKDRSHQITARKPDRSAPTGTALPTAVLFDAVPPAAERSADVERLHLSGVTVRLGRTGVVRAAYGELA